MVYTYQDVETLWDKYLSEEQNITPGEAKELEKYIGIKQQFKDKPATNKKHLHRAKSLYRRLKKQKGLISEVAEV